MAKPIELLATMFDVENNRTISLPNNFVSLISKIFLHNDIVYDQPFIDYVMDEHKVSYQDARDIVNYYKDKNARRDMVGPPGTWSKVPILADLDADEIPWIDWDGGECPTSNTEAVVKAQCRDGTFITGKAGELFWRHTEITATDIIKYHII